MIRLPKGRPQPSKGLGPPPYTRDGREKGEERGKRRERNTPAPPRPDPRPLREPHTPTPEIRVKIRMDLAVNRDATQRTTNCATSPPQPGGREIRPGPISAITRGSQWKGWFLRSTTGLAMPEYRPEEDYRPRNKPKRPWRILFDRTGPRRPYRAPPSKD